MPPFFSLCFFLCLISSLCSALSRCVPIFFLISFSWNPGTDGAPEIPRRPRILLGDGSHRPHLHGGGAVGAPGRLRESGWFFSFFFFSGLGMRLFCERLLKVYEIALIYMAGQPWSLPESVIRFLFLLLSGQTARRASTSPIAYFNLRDLPYCTYLLHDGCTAALRTVELEVYDGHQQNSGKEAEKT